ncbi:helix-turn-helix domain-containing protein [Streptomyces sp. NPDC018955]|uniref:helix-turn-helix domain-containing protein n=1 Tax=Streptomyces sp. NPDC018955 TaxID=3365055 RepID=UPI0037902EC0
MLRTESSDTRHLTGHPADTPPSAGPDGGVQIVRDHSEELHGTVARNSFGEVRVRLVTGDPLELIRPGRLITDTAEGFVRVLRPLSGQLWVFQDGRHAVARAPQFVCFDTTRPFKVVMPERFRMVDVLLPHRLTGLTSRETETLTVDPWCGARGLPALASLLLAGLDKHADEIQAALDLFGSSVAGLASALFAERMQVTATAPDVARHAQLLHIKAFIRERLAEPALGPALVARRHNISLRYLQRLFQQYGTSPARWIRDERLERCRAELSDPRYDHLPVAVIGERSGLYGASHFSRLFRDRYGISPRDYRKARQPATGNDTTTGNGGATPTRPTPGPDRRRAAP